MTIFNDAIDNQTLELTTGGEAAPVVDVLEFHIGTSSVKFSSPGYMKNSKLSSQVEGPGTLKFWWASNCRGELTDMLGFELDGWPVEMIYGPNDPLVWEQKSIAIPEGVHSIEWSFWQGDDGPIEHSGWLDGVTFTSSNGKSGRGFSLSTSMKL